MSKGTLEEAGGCFEVREDGGPGSHLLVCGTSEGRGRGRPAWPEVLNHLEAVVDRLSPSSNDPLLLSQ